MDYPSSIGNPSDWVLLGEGNANAVFGYRGHDQSLIGWVLRVDKGKTFMPEQGPASSCLSRLEQTLWSVYPALVHASDEIHRRVAYVEHVIVPLLTRKYVHQQALRPTHRAWLQPLLQQCTHHGPLHTAADDVPVTIALQQDHTRMSPTTSATIPHQSTICVEIKPKSGILYGNDALISPGLGIKKHVLRYLQHQHYKQHKGSIHTISTYNPHDLFSQDQHRIVHALHALWECPQNNLKLFIDGSAVAMHDAHTAATAVADALKGMLVPGAGVAVHTRTGLADGCTGVEMPDSCVHTMLRVIASILHREECLSLLLQAQAIDTVHVEGCYALLCRLMEQECGLCGHVQGMPLPPTAFEGLVDSIRSTQKNSEQLPMQEAQQLLRNYLIATTLKDCALMVALRPLHTPKHGQDPGRQPGEIHDEHVSMSTHHVETPTMGDCDDGCGVVWDEDSGLLWEYKVAFVDLDVKPLGKLPHQYALDQAIAQHAAQCMAEAS